MKQGIISNQNLIVRNMLAKGFSLNEIAEIVGITPKEVTFIKNNLEN